MLYRPAGLACGAFAVLFSGSWLFGISPCVLGVNCKTKVVVVVVVDVALGCLRAFIPDLTS